MSILNLSVLNKIKNRVSDRFLAKSIPYGKNIFDKDSIITDRILNSNGVEILANNNYTSDYIPVISGSSIKLSAITEVDNTHHFAFYDIDKKVLKVYVASEVRALQNILKVPSNASFFRCSGAILGYPVTHRPDNLQIEYGKVSTAYEDFSAMPRTPNFQHTQDVNVTTNFETINSGVLPSGKNLFNKNTISSGFLSSSNVFNANSDYYYSDYIKVFPYSKISLYDVGSNPYASTCFYDSNKKFISGITNEVISETNIINIPKDIYYIRVSVQILNTSPDSMQIEYGSKRTTYEEYSSVPTQVDFSRPQEVKIVSGEDKLPSNFVDKDRYTLGYLEAGNNYLRYVKDNHVIWTGTDRSIVFYSDKGLGDDYKLDSSKITKQLNISDLPSVYSGSVLSKAVIYKTITGVITMLFTDKNQIYYSSSGVFGEFKLSTIWGLRGRAHNNKATGEGGNWGRNKFYMPKNISERASQFSWFNSLLINKKEVSGNYVEHLLFANYQLGSGNTATPSCLFHTVNGKDIYTQYMFGIPCGKVKKAGTDEYISLGVSGWGDDLDTSLFPSYTTGLTLQKRTSIIPSEVESDPAVKFEYGDILPITQFTSANKAVATVADASSFEVGNVIMIKGDSGNSDWNSLVDTTGTNGVNGVKGLFSVTKIEGNNLTLAETIGNYRNNLVPRHIHSLNFFANGVAIGTGEVYPQSWLVFQEIAPIENTTIWESSLLLTTSEKSLQRSMGVHLRRDNKIIFASDDQWVKVESKKLIIRDKNLTTTTAGVWLGNLEDVDDIGKFNNILWGADPVFKFIEIVSGVLLCVTVSGMTYLSFDDGDSWEFATCDNIQKTVSMGNDSNERRYFFGGNVFIELK